MHVIVIGAGVFGTWTARWLRRRGVSVTLVDQYGPGNSLSSSGDESRVTRSAHGPDELYPAWQRRSLEQWLPPAPALLERLGIPSERLGTDALARRFNQIRTDDLAWGLYEPEAGVLLARRAVAATARAVVEEGGEDPIGLA